MKKTKRIISVITALVLVFTLFAVMPLASAEETEPNYTVEYRTADNYSTFAYRTDADYATLGTSLIANKIPNAYYLDDELNQTKFTVTAGELAKVTDGVVYNDDSKKWAKINSSDGNYDKVDLEYDMVNAYSVDKIVVASYHNKDTDFGAWSTQRYIGKYQVYIADTKDNLYDESNLVYSYDSSKETEATGVQVISFAEKCKGRYFAIRVLQSYNDATLSNSYPHFNEIAVYGENVYTVEHRHRNNYANFSCQTDADYAALGTSLIANKIPNAYYLDDELNQTKFTVTGGELAKVTDGTVLSTAGAEWAKINTSNGNYNKVDLEYDMLSVCDVDKIVVASYHNRSVADNDVNWAVKRYIGKYEVYISQTKADLYDKSNLVYSYDSSEETSPSGVQIISFAEKCTGRYFAIRILQSFNDTSVSASPYPRLNEIAVYGDKDYDVQYRTADNYTTFYYTKDSFAAIGTNLISGKQATPTIYDENVTLDKIVTVDESTKNTYVEADIGTNIDKLSMLTDGLVQGTDKTNYAQLYYAGGGDKGNVSQLDLTYDLGGFYDVDRFVLLGLQASNTSDSAGANWALKLCIGEYEVYLSDSVDNLYDENNLIYSYKYEKDKFRSDSQNVTFNKDYTGRYIGVRILDCVSLNENDSVAHQYPRIAEIGVYGEKVVKLGDVNDDGNVDFRDLVRLGLYLDGRDVAIVNGDIDGIGDVNENDLIALRKKLLNK